MKNKYNFRKSDSISEFLKVWFEVEFKYTKNTEIFRRYYKNYVKNFSNRMQFFYSYQTKDIIKYISMHKKSKVLEIGCGCGTESLYMAYACGAEVVGIDIQSSRLDVAKERLEILESQSDKKIQCRFSLESVLNHEITHDGYDVIWMEQAFHHLEPRDQIVKKITSLLKPGGRLFIAESNFLNILIQLVLFKKRGFKTIKTFTDENGEISQYGDERIISSKSLSKLFKLNGINTITIDYFRCFPSGNLFDKFLDFEIKIPKMLKFLFTHYNYIGIKK